MPKINGSYQNLFDCLALLHKHQYVVQFTCIHHHHHSHVWSLPCAGSLFFFLLALYRLMEKRKSVLLGQYSQCKIIERNNKYGFYALIIRTHSRLWKLHQHVPKLRKHQQKLQHKISVFTRQLEVDITTCGKDHANRSWSFGVKSTESYHFLISMLFAWI